VDDFFLDCLLFLCMPLTRNLIWLIVTASIIFGCGDPSTRLGTPDSLLPENTEALLKINQWEQWISEAKNHSIYSQLKEEPFTDFLTNHPQFTSAIHPKGRVFLTYGLGADNVKQYTIIANKKALNFIGDSISGLKAVPLTNQQSIIKNELNGELFFSTQIDSVQILSTSESVLMDIRNGAVLKDIAFEKAFKVKREKDLTYVGHLPASSDKKWAGQATFEMQLIPDGLIGHGVVLDQDSLGQVLSLFRGQIPQKMEAPSVIASNASRAISVGFSNTDSLESRLRLRFGDSLRLNPLFETVSEMVKVEGFSGSYVALRTLDPTQSWESIASYLTSIGNFREAELYQLQNDALFEPFSLLIGNEKYHVVFEFDDFIVFAQDQNQAQEIIAALLNHSVLGKTGTYEANAASIAQSASLVFYEMNGKLDEFTSSLLHSEPVTIKGYPLMITQLIYDRDFAHLNLVAKSGAASQSISSGPVKQLASIKLDADLLLPPKFFTNHNTGGKDVVVQDMSNQLYLISSNGKILWKKKLDGPILGGIQEVDILRNGKKQLAFATAGEVHILDRNGNAVAPFPKKFKDPITQPLAIFDYDNNRKYRFVVTQGRSIFMYDAQGKTVTGFNFTKAGSNIVLPPQHLRIGNKDYITIAEESGKLHILSRVGKERIAVGQKFEFGDLPIEREGSDFVVITKDHTKVSIDQNGKISSQKLEVTNSYHFVIVGNTKLTLDDNLMRINGKLTELPVGIYSRPQLLNFGKNQYATLTETKEHKIYLYDKSGNLLSNFPIYGTSEIDLADANRNGKMVVVVQGDRSEVLLYQLQ